MLKSLVVGTSLALAALAVPAVAQQRTPGTPGMPSQQPAPAQKDMGSGSQTLTLTQEEKHTVLQNVGKSASSGTSTMGLGAITEGGAVPSGMKTQKFSDTVTTKVPKLKTYSYFAADNKVAIVEPNGGKIAAVLDQTSSSAK